MRDLIRDQMRDAVIRLTYPTVVNITDDGAIDGDGNLIPLDEAKIAADITKIQAAHLATQYRRDRAKSYPSLGDQFDALFHAGAFPPEMAAQIQAIKDKYPKVIP